MVLVVVYLFDFILPIPFSAFGNRPALSLHATVVVVALFSFFWALLAGHMQRLRIIYAFTFLEMFGGWGLLGCTLLTR